MSGIAQFIANKGINRLKHWSDNGYKHLKEYDSYISKDLGIPESIKITSIKPSGTVSLLAGATPGLHFPESQYYIRRVRLSSYNAMVPILEAAGYKTEPDTYTPNTVCVEVPVNLGPNIRTLSDTTLWEQLSLAALLQKYWADNQVSCTVTFDPKTESKNLKPALDYFQYQLKGVSFLPRSKESYTQMPYEEINREKYEAAQAKIKSINLSRELQKSSKKIEDSVGEKY